VEHAETKRRSIPVDVALRTLAERLAAAREELSRPLLAAPKPKAEPPRYSQAIEPELLREGATTATMDPPPLRARSRRTFQRRPLEERSSAEIETPTNGYHREASEPVTGKPAPKSQANGTNGSTLPRAGRLRRRMEALPPPRIETTNGAKQATPAKTESAAKSKRVEVKNEPVVAKPEPEPAPAEPIILAAVNKAFRKESIRVEPESRVSPPPAQARKDDSAPRPRATFSILRKQRDEPAGHGAATANEDHGEIAGAKNSPASPNSAQAASIVDDRLPPLATEPARRPGPRLVPEEPSRPGLSLAIWIGMVLAAVGVVIAALAIPGWI
jgi:hypothetical protein